MQLASIVSERFGFAIPGSYGRMVEAGLLSAPPRSKKHGKARPAAKMKPASATPVRALATSDLHWLAAAEIAARIERLEQSRTRRPRWPADFVFVPFAESGEGNEWGWAPSLGVPGTSEPPIMLISRDTGDARIVAPTFATFLFRMTLEALAQCPHDPASMSLPARIHLLRESARAVLDFLPAELSARLDRVLDLPVRKVVVRTLRERNGRFFRVAEATHLSLVAADWAARIVREEIEDARVDQILRID